MSVISAPVEVPFTATQGSPFVAVLQFFSDVGLTTPVDLTGWSFRMQIREGVADSGADVKMALSSEDDSEADARILFIAEASDGEPDFNGTPDPTNGMICLRLSSTETASIKATKAPKKGTFPAVAAFFYDVEGTPPAGEPERIAFGTFDLTLEVTRS